MPNIAQIDPYQVQNISVLKRPNAQQARTLLEKVARQVQPILRRRCVGTIPACNMRIAWYLLCQQYFRPSRASVDTSQDDYLQEMERTAAVRVLPPGWSPGALHTVGVRHCHLLVSLAAQSGC